MDNSHFDISLTPIKMFLDTVDSVLNSNTFLLHFELKTNNYGAELLNFICSESFMNQIINQDRERGWFNLHFYDQTSGSYKIRNGNIIKDALDLKIKEITNGKDEYLMAMLTGDTSKGHFYSFYSQQISIELAKPIVDNLILFLTDSKLWRLFVVDPNFLKSSLDVPSGEVRLSYFDGEYGNDTATLIVAERKAFLLLTNGRP